MPFIEKKTSGKLNSNMNPVWVSVLKQSPLTNIIGSALAVDFSPGTDIRWVEGNLAPLI